MHNVFISQRRHKEVSDHVTAIGKAGVDRYLVPPEQENRIEFHETLHALNALPAEQRQVLVLVAVEHLSYAEVAQVLGVPIGTVMSRLSRGRKRLRRTVEG
jgi:RNA polymerase sigma-70 factor (ECF subfamily)